VVLGEAGPVSGEFRLREFVHLAGEERTFTVHRENGCAFEVDLAKAYFSPRLSGERSRVVSLVREGERVLDMFSGVGPFAIQVAKHRKVPVTAVELNPDAYRFLVRNVALNRVDRLVEPINEDARKVASSRPKAYDRVIMNHPSASLDFLREALIAAREGGHAPRLRLRLQHRRLGVEGQDEVGGARPALQLDQRQKGQGGLCLEDHRCG
jgi:tRNA (guanine37-N1)-methyltransferase